MSIQTCDWCGIAFEPESGLLGQKYTQGALLPKGFCSAKCQAAYNASKGGSKQSFQAEQSPSSGSSSSGENVAAKMVAGVAQGLAESAAESRRVAAEVRQHERAQKASEEAAELEWESKLIAFSSMGLSNDPETLANQILEMTTVLSTGLYSPSGVGDIVFLFVPSRKKALLRETKTLAAVLPKVEQGLAKLRALLVKGEDDQSYIYEHAKKAHDGLLAKHAGLLEARKKLPLHRGALWGGAAVATTFLALSLGESGTMVGVLAFLGFVLVQQRASLGK